MADIKNGREFVDPTPVEVPLRFRKNVSEAQRTKQLIREVLSDYAADQGAESFREANDFFIPGEDNAELDFGLSESEIRVMEQEYLLEQEDRANLASGKQPEVNHGRSDSGKVSGSSVQRDGKGSDVQGSGRDGQKPKAQDSQGDESDDSGSVD